MKLIRHLLEMGTQADMYTIGVFDATSWFDRITPHELTLDERRRADNEEWFEVSEESRQSLLEWIHSCRGNKLFKKIVWVNLILDDVETIGADDEGPMNISDLYDGDDDEHENLRNAEGERDDDDYDRYEGEKRRHYSVEFVVEGKIPDSEMEELAADVGGTMFGQYWDDDDTADCEVKYCTFENIQDTLDSNRRGKAQVKIAK